MARYDYGYITTLLADMRAGDPDARAGIFAATYKQFYQVARKGTGDAYAAQDILQAVYSRAFSREDLPKDGKVFIRLMNDEVKEAARAYKKGDDIRAASDAENETLSQDNGELLLHYISSTLHQDASHFPLATLEAYNDYRKSQTSLQRVIIIIILGCLLLLPFFLIPPKIIITEGVNSTEWDPHYDVTVKSILFPVDTLTAVIDDSTMSVSENADGTYEIHPILNGEMTVTATLVTGRASSTVITVDSSDLNPPTVASHEVADGKLTITFTDDLSGLDGENAYAALPDGTIQSPLAWDDEACTVTFATPESGTNLFIPDVAGNVRQIIVSYE